MNTVLGQVGEIANKLFFLKNKQFVIGKMALFYCNSVLYVGLEDSFCEFNRLFLRKSMFF